MKTRIFLLLTIFLCTSLTACSNTAVKEAETEIYTKTFSFYKDTAGNSYTFEFDEEAKQHSYSIDNIKRDGDTVTYENDTDYIIRKGVDVSKWQNYVDWEKVKADGYDFAFMRLGYRGYEEGLLHVDNTYHQNMANARKAGLDIGVYFFSQALNEEEAIEEANFVIENLKNYKLQLPVVYDPEFVDKDTSRTNGLTKEQITKNTIAFCETIQAAGYTPMVYANMYWQANLLDMSEIDSYQLWTADYTDYPQTPYAFSFWQYSDTGKVDGISGNADLNIQFIPAEEASSDTHAYDFTLCFAGDMSLEEEATTTAALDASEHGIYDCISPEFIEIMQNAELTCVNNEFTYTDRGTPTPSKYYTFRADPSRVAVMQELGVDVVTLANNHVYDFGKISLLDTLDTLDNAHIDYFGAGRNLEEAMRPVYYEIDGKTIAFVGASRAEKFRLTPQATEDSPGILRCYDTELFLDVIKEADENADFVIAVVHWGTEHSTVLEDAQLTTGKDYIDAGADVIIGGHSHCLQGMEFYKGKPIFYSLGNYWFDQYTLDTMLVELHFTGDDTHESVEIVITPGIQTGSKTYIVEDEEKEKLFRFLEDISINIAIDEHGIMTEIDK